MTADDRTFGFVLVVIFIIALLIAISEDKK